MATTNQLLAALIVQVCRLQTRRAEYPMDVLTGLGLSSREISAAIGTSEATVNVTKSRARKKVVGHVHSTAVAKHELHR